MTKLHDLQLRMKTLLTEGPMKTRQPSQSSTKEEHVFIVNDFFGEAEHKTLHRWSTEFVPQGVAQRAPRYFDGVKQAATYSQDTADLDHFSSFDCIAKDSIMQLSERQRKAAKADEERAHSWKLSIRGIPDPNEKGDDWKLQDSVFSEFVYSDSTQLAGGASTYRDRGNVFSATGQQSIHGGREPMDKTQKRILPIAPRITEARHLNIKREPMLAEPLGEDAPMTARLERILTGRNRPAATEENEQNPAMNSTASALLPPDSSRRALGKRPSQQFSGRGSERSLHNSRANSPQPGPRGSGGSNPPTARRPAEPSRLAVRTGGFQWIESQMQPAALPEEASCSSFRATAPPAPQDTPPISRSVSRSLQTKVSQS